MVTLESNPTKVRHFTDLQETEIDSLYSIRSLCSFSCQCWIVPHSKFWSASFSLNLKQLILIGFPPFPKGKHKIFLPSSIKCGLPLFRSKPPPCLATAQGNLFYKFQPQFPLLLKHLRASDQATDQFFPFWRNKKIQNMPLALYGNSNPSVFNTVTFIYGLQLKISFLTTEWV